MVDTWDELVDLANPNIRILVEANPRAYYACGDGWASEGSSTYSHVCSEVKVNSATDNGVEMTERASVALVKANAGSWYFDETAQLLYVRCFDDDDLSNAAITTIVMMFCWKMFSTDAYEIPVEMDGLVGCWLFDEGSGMVAYDKSKNGNHGSLENMEEADWVNGKVGKALDFDGVNDWVKLPINAFSTSPVSMAFWIKTTETREMIPLSIEGAWIFKVGRGGSNNKIGVTFTGSTVNMIDSTSVINDNEWHFVVGTHDGTTARLYIDGSEENSATQSLFNIDGLSRVSAIGGQYNGSFNVNALIDEVRIYNRALIGDEIEALYNLSSLKLIPCMPVVRQDSIPVLDLAVDDLVEGMYRFNFGSFKMNNPVWFDKAAEAYLWTNCTMLVKLGGEDLPYSEHVVYFAGKVSDYYVGDEDVVFTVKDLRVGTYAQIPVDHYWRDGSNYPQLALDAESLAIPVFYGIKTGIVPVCIDTNNVDGSFPYPSGSTWKIAGSRKIKEFTAIKLNLGSLGAVTLTETTHYTTDLNNAEFTLLIPLAQDDYLEVDAKGFVDGSDNLMEKAGEIAKDILKTYLGYIDADLDLSSFALVDTDRPYEICAYIDIDKSSRQVLQTLGRSVIGFITPVEDGKLAFEIYVGAVPAGTMEFFDRDYGTDWKVKLDDFFLRNKVRVQYDQSPNTQEFKSVEKTNYDVLYKYGVRETLIIETYLKEASDAGTIAQAIQNMCSVPVKIAEFSCGVKAFKLFPTRKVKLTRSRAVDSSGAWNAKIFRVKEVVKDNDSEQTHLIVSDDFQLLGNIPHVNVAHTDVSYSHTPHVNTPHDNAPHTNTAYTHTPHTDDASHTDEPHEDELNGEHDDTPHEDIEYDHIPHVDGAHTDAPHNNTPYSHTPHTDTPYSHTPHQDTPHLDTSV